MLSITCFKIGMFGNDIERKKKRDMFILFDVLYVGIRNFNVNVIIVFIFIFYFGVQFW